MAIDVFSLAGKIAIDYSDAVKGLEKVQTAAGDTAESLDDVDDAAGKAGNSVDDAGDSAKKASDGFTTWKGVIANLVANAITGLISKCTQLAGKITDLTKTAVGNYADYEQLVGGVETLFKDSSGTLIRYAEKAYKTAGMSSNKYMETATSFAASLIQGLGGDTAKAVELTDLAITDMSDNANKMGTDMEAIQNAYQGFAKQNYTMLDNLKLGYGGTQSEMIRLINDSGILNEEISSLDDITFDQMVEAIHAVQTSLGITGTTALEAGTTIQGSWKSVQALFQNILTKVGSQLAPVVMGFLSQLSGWMESIDWDEFAATVGDAFSEVLNWIQQIDFTTFFEQGIQGVISFVQGLGNLVTLVVNVIRWFNQYKSVLSAVARIAAVVVAAFASFPIINTVVSLVNIAKTAFTALFMVLNANPFVLIVSLIAGLVAAIITLWNTNENFRNAVISVWESIKTAITTAVDAIRVTVTTVWNAIKDAITTAMNTIQSTISSIWNSIKSTVSSVINSIKSTISTVFNAIKSTISNILNSIHSAFSSVWSGVKSTVSGAINSVKSTISSGLNTAKSTVSTVLGSIKSKFSSIFESCKSVVSSAINKIKSIMHFSWSLPHLKLPHISISGSFSLKPPSVPHFSISWYKKAMDEPYMFTRPTIFDVNPMTGQARGAGEAGDELMLGRETLLSMIRQAVSAENTTLAAKIDELILVMLEYLPQIANMQMVTDTGVLIGELTPGITRGVKKEISREQKSVKARKGE